MQDPVIAHYNHIMAAFYASQSVNVEGDWSQHSVGVATAESLRNRARLREALNHLGFELR